MATLDQVTLGKSLSSLSFDLPICQMEMMPQQRTKCSPSVMSAATPGRASSLAQLLTPWALSSHAWESALTKFSIAPLKSPL